MRFLQYISVYILLISTVDLIQAQGLKELNLNTPQAAGTYVARDKVKLSQGVSAKSSTGVVKFTLDPNIAPIGTYNSLPTSSGQPTNQMSWTSANAVGTTPGKEDVNSNGGATYTIPISIPAGTSGMQPNLSINYNSQANDGALGNGWSLGGTSMINLVPRTPYYNTDVSNIPGQEYGFALDGDRLILVSGIYGANASEYRTEIDSYKKIFITNALYGGFIVQTKDGSIYEYGVSNPNSIINSGRFGENIPISNQTPYSYRLTKVTDANGNSILYTYMQENGESWLYKIDYTVNETQGLSPYATIQFYYVKRQDKNELYTNNYKISQTRLLEKINIAVKGELFRQYDFYYASREDKTSLLSEVKETGADGKFYNTTKVTWGLVSNGDATFVSTGMLTVDPETEYINGSHFFVPQQILSGDFDGDGINEFINYTQGSLTYPKDYVTSNTKWTLTKKDKLSNTFTQAATGKFNLDLPCPNNARCDFTNIYVMFNHLTAVDIDKDGKSEIIQLAGYKQDATHTVQARVYQYDGTTLQEVTNSFPRFRRNYTCTNSAIRYDYQVQVGDYDGDNNLDMMLVQIPTVNVVYTPTTTYKIIDINNKSMEGNPINTSNFGVYTGNANGNSKTDVFVVTLLDVSAIEYDPSTTNYRKIVSYIGNWSGTKTSLSEYNFTILDFNSDGLSDVYYGDGTNAYITYTKNSNSNTFVNLGRRLCDNCLFGDFIGDVKPELVLTSKTSLGVTFNFYSISENGLNLIKSKSVSYTGLNLKYYLHQRSAIDYNSDGKDDLLIPEDEHYEYIVDEYGDNNLTFISGKYQVYAPTSLNDFQNLVASIEDGYGKTSSFNYELLNLSSKYTRTFTGTAPIFNVVPAIPVVTAYSNYFIGSSNMVENFKFTYRNLQFNTNGLGIMGFDQVTKNNNYLAKTKTYTFQYPSTLAYQQITTNVMTKDNSGLLISESITNIPTITNSGSVIQIKATSSIQKDYIKQASSTALTNYDGYGNITSSESKNFDDINASVLIYKEINTNIFKTFGSWCPSSLTENQQSVQYIPSGDAAIIYVTKYDYDGKGNVDVKYEFANDPNKITTTKYTSRKFGIPQNVAVTSVGGVEARSAIVTYDPTGRFVTERTNTLAQISKFKYDAFGNVVSTTGVDGITITQTYDGFGRPLVTNTPEGIVTKAYSWSSTVAGALYKVITTTTDKPTTTYYYDGFDRVIKSQTTGIKNTLINQDFVYDAYNATLTKKSKPYYTNETPIWIEFKYDNLFRTTKQTIKAVSTTYDYNGRIVTATDPKLRKTVTTSNALGKTVSVKDAKNNTTNFTYSNLLLPKTSGTNVITYNNYGNKTSLTDPNAGTTSYTYDAYGRCSTQTDVVGTYILKYDPLNRITSRIGPDENITYTYNVNGNGINQLNAVKNSLNNNGQTYAYDNLGRLISLKEQSEGQIFETKYAYDAQNGNLIQQTYPSTTFAVKNEYENGYLNVVRRVDNNAVIWTQGNVSSTSAKYILGNNQTVSYNYNQDYNVLTGINVDNKFNWSYNFEKETGNLTQRKDLSLNAANVSRNLVEDFKYDDLDRLTEIYQNTVLNNTMNYADNGNINSKTDAGTNYTYHSTRINAVEKIKPALTPGSAGAFSALTQAITYNGFKRPTLIADATNVNEYTISYGTNRQRVKSVLKANGALVKTTLYSNGFEREMKGGVLRNIHYITAKGGVVAVYITSNGVGQMYYPLVDHLGSIMQLRKDDGTIAEEMSYDAWGRRRNPETWSTTTVTTPTILSRGYTGHEHLDAFNLINMNARLYDPLAGRMLSPDEELLNPENSQHYNKYTYVSNNPLKFTDPTGNSENYGSQGVSPYGDGGYGPRGGSGGGSRDPYSNPNNPNYQNHDGENTPDALPVVESVQNLNNSSGSEVEVSNGNGSTLGGTWYYLDNQDNVIYWEADPTNKGDIYWKEETEGWYKGVLTAVSNPNQIQEFYEPMITSINTPVGDIISLAGAYNSMIGMGFEGAAGKLPLTQASRMSNSAKAFVLKGVKYTKVLGLVGVAANTLIDLNNVNENGGSTEAWTRLGVGVAITATGFIPFAGPVIAIGLGSIEACGGFDSLYDYAAGRP